MPQADENAGAPPPPPQPRARERRSSRLPWLVLGLLVTAAALATVWQRWSELAPAAPAEAAHPAQTEPPPPAPAGESESVPPRPAAVAEAAPRPATPDRAEERKAYEGFRISLDVWAADNDNDPLTYQWTQTGGPSVTIRDADKPHAYFMACEPGRYVFAIRVSDGKDTSMAQVVRTVKDTDLAGRSTGKD